MNSFWARLKFDFSSLCIMSSLADDIRRMFQRMYTYSRVFKFLQFVEGTASHFVVTVK